MQSRRFASTPSVSDFCAFAASRRLLFTNDIPRGIRDLRAHRVYCWLRHQPPYRDAERRLRRLPEFQQQISPPGAPPNFSFPEDWELLWFASLVSQALAEYFQALSNPHRRRVITKADYREAQKYAGRLQALLEQGLEIAGPIGNVHALGEMLELIRSKPSQPVFSSTKDGQHVPAMVLSRVLCALIEGHYEIPMTPIIYLLVRIVEPDISSRVVRRHLQPIERPKRTDNR